MAKHLSLVSCKIESPYLILWPFGKPTSQLFLRKSWLLLMWECLAKILKCLCGGMRSPKKKLRSPAFFRAQLLLLLNQACLLYYLSRILAWQIKHDYLYFKILLKLKLAQSVSRQYVLVMAFFSRKVNYKEFKWQNILYYCNLNNKRSVTYFF